MKLGVTLYVWTRAQWRRWLASHHDRASEIWLIYPKAHSGKPRIPYNHAVEEALCFGWIDSLLKTVDADRFAQRFTPRKSKSPWSPMNKERVRRLIRAGRMTASGMARVPAELRSASRSLSRAPRLVLAPDIRAALRADPATWAHFRRFPASYKRIRIGWIEGARVRPQVFRQRLGYFLRMTAKNRRFGVVQ
ncbi:MAG: YdeI/OmpD-associated family protein [Anaerolineales bacterium]